LNRPRHPAGFSLVEALVTLLVLSIGLLGLAQLQVRLWRSSTDLHAMQSAVLAAHDLLEARTFNGSAGAGRPALPQAVGKSYFTEITTNNPSPTAKQLVATNLKLHWRESSGEKSVNLTATRNQGIDPKDTRWLLPSP
jgi:type IV pilus assembly protein PilV